MTPDLQPLAGLLRQVRDLKRVRDARSARSLLERTFVRSWARLCAGEATESIARSESAAAVAGVRLAGLDAAVMTAHGLDDDEVLGVLHRAFDDVAGPLDEAMRQLLRDALGALPRGGNPPPFVDALVRQPRAGATHPGLPRRVLEPSESHADHCAAVAVFGVLLAPAFGADPSRVFLTGLTHHLFNVSLPDAGYAGDVLIGDDLLNRMAASATEGALSDLNDGLRQRTEEALATTHADQFETPEARAFHAADVLDRVLEMEWHETSARFQLADALGRNTDAGQLDICHDGFYQTFQQDVLARAGVWPLDPLVGGDGASGNSGLGGQSPPWTEATGAPAGGAVHAEHPTAGS
ncbi:MAG: HD domain-containing protein [Bacteroidota bacterium]